MPNRTQHRQGRHRPETDDAEIFGDDLELTPEDFANVQATTNLSLTDRCKRDYRNRINQMYTFWEAHYNDFYNGVIQELTLEDIGDSSKYHWKNKHDLKYSSLNPRFIKAFLSHVKKKKDGNLMSFEGMHKFHDALLWGAKTAGYGLPSH